MIALALVAAIGCSSSTRMPNVYHPGTAQSQRMDAVRYDPYPLDDVGPEVTGARPLAYQRPLNEVKRAQLFAPPRVPLQSPW